MQTIELDIDAIKSPKELTEILKNKHFHEGDNLILKTEDEKNFFILGVLLIVLMAYFINKKNRQKQGEELLNNLLSKYDSPEELEKDIERQYGINIEFETQNPIEFGFGLWKDYDDIDAETLRKKAWRRKK